MLHHTIFLPLLTLLTLLPPLLSHQSPDLIIIGAGTSGCVLAARLCTALPNSTILLLERAPARTPPQNLFIQQPRNTIPSWSTPTTSEIFPSLPEPSLLNRSIPIVTGNTLGGSSAINALQWSVPPPDTIPAWRIAGLLPAVAARFYRAAFRQLRFGAQPMAVRSGLEQPYLHAAREAGFATAFQPFDNDATHQRMWPQAVAVSRAGRRRDSCSAYLTPRVRAGCANLAVRQGVTVTKLLFRKEDGARVPRVHALRYVATTDRVRKRERVVRVRKEVLLSAGPFGSPKLLMLSGIGPARELKRHGIDVVHDLGVGTRTQARGYNGVASVYTGMPLEPGNNSTVRSSRHTTTEWLNGRASILAGTGFMTMGTVERSAYCMSASALGEDKLDVPALYSICVGNPSAYGWLRLKDKDPFSSPVVRLNLLAKRVDVHRMQVCMRRLQGVHNKLPSWMQAAVVSPPTGMKADDERFLRAGTNHAYHFVAGCAVGKVVRGNLKVKGVEGVRVVDASVLNRMPTSAGPMASVYMMAEYAAERLAGVYGRGEEW